jgi:serine/threonine-protein kinase
VVAIKRMHPHLADSPEFVELFFREAQVASTLDHPNLVAVHESGQDGGQYFLVMEYVDGISLRQLVSRVRKGGGAFDVAVAVSIATSICAGLHHAHERGDDQGRPLQIVHRDVSPGNVFVSYDGAVKLGDFGVAKATSEWTAMHSTTGTIRGKVAYMAPEQARGDAVDRRADVFAVGNVLFELLAGRRLIQARGEVEMLHELVFGAYGVVARALQRSPDERFATALEMQRALEVVALEHGVFAPPSAVAAFVSRHAARAADDATDPNAPTTVRPSPAVVAARPARAVADAPTRTVDQLVAGEPIPGVARSRSWIAIPVVLALGSGLAWVVARPEATMMGATSLELHAPAVARARPSLRVEIDVRVEAEEQDAKEPSKRRRKATKRRRASDEPREQKPSARKPPQGESLFPGQG